MNSALQTSSFFWKWINNLRHPKQLNSWVKKWFYFSLAKSDTSTPFSFFVPLNNQCKIMRNRTSYQENWRASMQLPPSPQDIDSPQRHDKKKLLDALTLLIQILHPHDQGKNQSTSNDHVCIRNSFHALTVGYDNQRCSSHTCMPDTYRV